MRPMIIDEKKISEILKEENIECKIIAYSVTDSTNLRAKEWAAEHTENRSPVVFIADSQTAGRGRLGRSFHSAAGTGIYITFLLYPESRGFDATAVTAYSAVKLARAVEGVSSAVPKIKWVNDLYLEDKKLAGILAEGVMHSDGSLACLILGMGINVYKTAFPGEISAIATTIEDATGEHIDRDAFAAEIIKQILSQIYNPNTDDIYNEYVSRSAILGKELTVTKGNESYAARALEIARDFSLIVDRGGSVERLFTGEVSAHLKNDQ